MIQKFSFQEMDLKGAYIIKPFYATDERGGLIKDYNIDTFKAAGIDHELKETFYTLSKRCVIRAIHFQLEKPQPKLMRCISGKIWYVIVDLRPESETFGQYRSMILRGEDPTCILCPAGKGAPSALVCALSGGWRRCRRVPCIGPGRTVWGLAALCRSILQSGAR